MRPLLLERYYAQWEFDVKHNLSASDPEPVGLQELLALADDEARQLWENHSLGYIEPDGIPLLREEIAAQYRGIKASEVILTTGAQEAIYLAINALVAPGDHVVVIGPAYQVLYEAARVSGAEVTIVPLKLSRGWTLDHQAVVEAFRVDTKLLVVNFPHNPTGFLPSAREYERLMAACDQRGIRLFSDEVFRGLEPKRELRLPAAVEEQSRAITVGDVSKGYGLAGLRVGWIACKDADVLRRVALGRDYTTISGAGPSQLLALIAIRVRERLQARARSIIAENLKAVARVFAMYEDRVEWIPPDAGTTAFPRLRRGDVHAFCERLAAEERVLLAPGSLFETDKRRFRLGLGHRHSQVALSALERALAEI